MTSCKYLKYWLSHTNKEFIEMIVSPFFTKDTILVMHLWVAYIYSCNNLKVHFTMTLKETINI